MAGLREDDSVVRIQHEPIDIGNSFAFLQSDRSGGHCLFLGTTRRWTDERETVELRYEAYESMAIREITRMLHECRKRWPVQRVIVVHRIGVVEPPQASVLVGVAAAHRSEAFEACRYLIDTLKQKAPIWKKEVFGDGREEWVRGQIPS